MNDLTLGDTIETTIGSMTRLACGVKLIGLKFGDQDWRIGCDLKSRFSGDVPEIVNRHGIKVVNQILMMVRVPACRSRWSKALNSL
jgi:membrane protein implicated in regulation of membrane protease activity